MTILDEETIKPIMKAFADMLTTDKEEDGFTSKPDTDAFYSDTDPNHSQED